MCNNKARHIKGRQCMNWDADDLFGSPPPGPIHQIHRGGMPHPGIEDVHRNNLYIASAGPADVDHYRVHNHERKFELRTDQRACASPGSWPGLCTISIDHSHTLIKHTVKHGFNSEERFERPWGFVIRQETHTEHNGRCREWWTIKVVLQRYEDPDYSHHTSVLWSAPIAATPAGQIRKFAEWARSRGFETVRDFFSFS